MERSERSLKFRHLRHVRHNYEMVVAPAAAYCENVGV